MRYPEDLTIKLCNDEPSPLYGGGSAYMMTRTGSYLSTLTQMWDMTYEQVIEKVALEACMEEERFIVDGEYVKPHRRVVFTEADYE